ncbi:hypothetical protein EMIT0180MI3_360038 [Priestia megaterium]
MAAAQLADRVHGERRQADVHGAHAQVAGGDRADGRAAAHVAAHHEALHRYFFGHAQMTEEPGGFAVGGVALVAVDLDYRAGVEFRAVVGVVLVGVVRVHAVGVVGRDQQGFLNGPYEFIPFGQQATQGLLKHRTVGATGRAGTDFFVIVADQHAGFVCFGRQQCLQAGVARQQVVQASARDEIAMQADDGSTLGVVEAQLVIEHHVGVQAMFAGQLIGEHGAEVHAFVTGELRENRRQFGLGIDRPAHVGFTVEVNGQVRNDCNGSLEVDQLALDLAIATEGHAAGQRQIAVEPRRQQRTAIDFDAQLPEALALQFRLGFDPQARAVGVRPNQANAAMQGRMTAHFERDDRRVVTGDVVTAIGFGGPWLALVEAHKTGRFQALDKAGGGMERGRGGLEEVDQALVQLFAHKKLQTAVAPV